MTQKQVREPMARYGLSLDPQIRVLDVASEVGELAKEVLKATGYGTNPLEKHAALEEELGDCLFSLLCQSVEQVRETLCRKRGNRPPGGGRPAPRGMRNVNTAWGAYVRVKESSHRDPAKRWPLFLSFASF